MRSMRKLATVTAVVSFALAAFGAGTSFGYAVPVGVVAQGEFTGVASGDGNTFAYTCTAHGVGPVGLLYLGTHHMPLMDASLATRRSTWATSGPSSFMGTVIIRTP